MNGKTQKRWQMGLLSAILLGLNIPSATLAQTVDAPPAGSVSIEGFAYGGSGCPQGSVGSLVSNDQTQIELLFDKFVTELAPPGTATTYPSTTNCTVTFELKYPSGWSVSWDQVQQRGFVDTTGGATAQIINNFYIPGTNESSTPVYTFGPNTVEDYTVTTNAISSVFTQCGANLPLDVDTRIRLSGIPTDYNTLTIDSETAKVATLLHLTWRRCS